MGYQFQPNPVPNGTKENVGRPIRDFGHRHDLNPSVKTLGYFQSGVGFGLITGNGRNTVRVMSKRKKFSLFYLVGAVLWGVFITILTGISRAFAGMSAVSVQRDDSITLVTLLLFLYFFVSMIGIFICDTRKALRIIALIGHLVLLGMFILLGKSFLAGSSKDVWDLFGLYAVVLFFLSPWLCFWIWLLNKYHPEYEQ